MTGTVDRVREKIRNIDRGTILFAEDFSSMGSQWSIRFSLSSLAAEGTIIRLSRGIYCYPRLAGEHNFKTVLPTPETIAEAVAARDKVRIMPFGDIYAYELGLSEMRISNHKYITDGTDKKINLADNESISFFHTSEVKQFDYRSEKMQKICTAIRAIGKDLLDENQKRKIHQLLREVSQKDFEHDIKIPPGWVQKTVISLWEN